MNEPVQRWRGWMIADGGYGILAGDKRGSIIRGFICSLLASLQVPTSER
jgi:hypothetical protein